MKKYLLVLLVITGITFLMSSAETFTEKEVKTELVDSSYEKYVEGWGDGYCEGWRDVKGQYANCPNTPNCPNPLNSCSDGYKCGYNRGFKAGYKAAQK